MQWKSFLLRTEPKTSSLEKFTDYTRSWERPAETEPATNFTTPWASGAAPPSSSLPAQVAWKVSADFGEEAQHRYHRALLEAYFTDNRTISELDVLADIAAECEIDRDKFKAAFLEQSEQLSQVVVEEHNSAIQHQVTAVPTIMIGGVFPIPGAQDVETYSRYIERYIDKRSEIEAIVAESADGESGE